MRIKNETDEEIIIPPGGTANVEGRRDHARTMVKRIPVFIVDKVSNVTVGPVEP